MLRLLFTMLSSGPSHVELHVVLAGVHLCTELHAHPPQSTAYMISIYISKSNVRNINWHILYRKMSLWDAAFSCSQSVWKKTIYIPELPKAKLNLHVTLKDSLYSKFLFYFSTCGNKYMVDNENSSGAKHPNWQFFTRFSRKFAGFSGTSHGFSRTLALLVFSMMFDPPISQHAYNVLPKLKVQC